MVVHRSDEPGRQSFARQRQVVTRVLDADAEQRQGSLAAALSPAAVAGRWKAGVSALGTRCSPSEGALIIGISAYPFRTRWRSPSRVPVAYGAQAIGPSERNSVVRLVDIVILGHAQCLPKLPRFAVPLRPRQRSYRRNTPIYRARGPIYLKLPKLEVAGSKPVRRL